MLNNVKGKLIDNFVIVKNEKQASQIYNKGYHGLPLSGGGLKLDLVEATFLVESNRLEVFKNSKKLNLEKIISYATKISPEFEIKYIVYRDLRLRGYIVKLGSPPFFRVFPRGGIPNKTLSQYWLAPISERTIFRIDDLLKQLKATKNIRKEFAIGIVDEEGDLTYYEVDKAEPKAKNEIKTKQKKGKGVFLEDRVMVWDEKLAKKLRENGFYGKEISNALQLSLVESAYLMENNKLEIKSAKTKRKLTLKGFEILAKKVQKDFNLRFKAYNALKKRGLIVKTGFKYGTHFRVYDDDPDSTHAPFLVHAVPKNYECFWQDVSRAVRLAHGVRKYMLFAVIKDKIEFIRIGRMRP